MITLVKDTIDNNDIDRLVDWLRTYPRLTKGSVTLKLERKYADWLGTEYAVFLLNRLQILWDLSLKQWEQKFSAGSNLALQALKENK